MSWLSQHALKVLRFFLDAPTAEVSGVDLIRGVGLLSGTVYPLLMRFEKRGLLSSRWESEEPAALGRPRKRLYRLTGDGYRVAHAALAELAAPGIRGEVLS